MIVSKLFATAMGLRPNDPMDDPPCQFGKSPNSLMARAFSDSGGGGAREFITR